MHKPDTRFKTRQYFQTGTARRLRQAIGGVIRHDDDSKQRHLPPDLRRTPVSPR